MKPVIVINDKKITAIRYVIDAAQDHLASVEGFGDSEYLKDLREVILEAREVLKELRQIEDLKIEGR